VVLKNLWRRRGRTVLTAGGIAIGVAVVVTLLAVADGLTGQITSMVSGAGADVTLMQAGIADMSFSALDQGLRETIAAMPDVAWVSGFLFNVVPAGDRPYLVVMGIDPQGPDVDHFRIVEGRWLEADREIALGRMAADFFGLGPGDTFVLQGASYRVVGIYETGVGYEDGGCVLPLGEAQRLFRRPDQVSFYRIKVAPDAVDRIDRLIADLESRFPQVLAYRSSEFAQNAPDIQTLRTLAGAVSLIGLVAGALGTMNTMLMSVLERTREIGTLRALGWRRRQVLSLILRESLALSLVGGGVGLMLGAALVALIGSLPALQGVLAGRITAPTLLTGLGVALVLGALGGLYPAWRAARLRPIEALRYE
jgi:ABC-type antimicrobial peptide transport system permease subunit